jgi:uncharacterized protein (DUF427 family)
LNERDDRLVKHPEPIKPGPGKESVWDYPRPPAVDPDTRLVKVTFNGVTLAETTRAIRVKETAQPPAFYFPRADVHLEYLHQTATRTVCEWKGLATYYTIRVGDRIARDAAWSYLGPTSGYQAIAGYLAFYPGRVDECTVDGEVVRPQPGDFYGGWITDEIVGPFKGEPGTLGW